MKYVLKENGGIPSSLLWTLAIITGITVANLYYSQPLLNLMRQDLEVSEFQASIISMITQAGYASGLFFIVPLGDLYQRKYIVLSNFSILILSLLTTALTSNIQIILVASFFTGFCSVIPQIFIPLASQFSQPEYKGRNVGIVVSGMLTGILVSRVISGLIGNLLGWRIMYYIATVLMLLCAVWIIKTLPDMKPNFKGTYRDLMYSLISLVRKYSEIGRFSIRAALAFGSFFAMFSCLAFKIGEAPFYAGSDVVGLLGLCGVVGAITASFVGRYIKKVGVHRFNLIGCTMMFAAWGILLFGGNTYMGIITGIIIMDLGMQCIHLSNQTCVFELEPKASNRINTIFMTTLFIGAAAGTFFSGFFWELYEWNGVVITGVILTFCSLCITLSAKK